MSASGSGRSKALDTSLARGMGRLRKVSKACCGFTWSITRRERQRRDESLPFPPRRDSSAGASRRQCRETWRGPLRLYWCGAYSRRCSPCRQDAGYAAVPKPIAPRPARIRSRTSPAMVAATSSEIACGCSIHLSEVGVCSGMSRWSGIGHASLHCSGSDRAVMGTTGKRLTQQVTNG